MIKKSSEYLNSTMLTHLFSMLIQPILEYSSNATRGSHYSLNIRKIEKVPVSLHNCMINLTLRG